MTISRYIESIFIIIFIISMILKHNNIHEYIYIHTDSIILLYSINYFIIIFIIISVIDILIEIAAGLTAATASQVLRPRS